MPRRVSFTTLIIYTLHVTCEECVRIVRDARDCCTTSVYINNLGKQKHEVTKRKTAVR